MNVASTLRVAVVGAGPAGLYLTEALRRRTDGPVTVDIFDRLPTPYGLLRYGVAPDHFKIKALAPTLHKILRMDGVRFFGHTEIGADLTAAELLADYHAVVYAVGASVDRRLNIPGEDLDGSVSAAELVAWYNGHPDAHGRGPSPTVTSALVIGLGNVALDVSRVLGQPWANLQPTDVPDDVLETMRLSRLQDVHIVGRRGAVESRFSFLELRELEKLENLDIIVDRGDLPVSDEGLTPMAKRNVDMFRAWAERPPTSATRRIHFHFETTPIQILGQNSVTGMRVRHRGEIFDLDVQLVVRAIGYRGQMLDGVPFDDEMGTVPTHDHRVLRATRSIGEYACGWFKRGAEGVLGTNRLDATATAAAIAEDRQQLIARKVTAGLVEELQSARGKYPVGMTEFAQIDDAEVQRGTLRGAARVKLGTWKDLLAVSRHSTTA